MKEWLIVKLLDQKLGIQIDWVEQVVNAATLIPISKQAEGSICGLLNLHGEMIPIYDTRQLLGFDSNEMELTDQFVICCQDHKKWGFWVEGTEGIASLAIREETRELPGLIGTVSEGSTPIFIYDLKGFMKR